MILENYNNIINDIIKHAKKSGRSPEDITLVAVSKTHPAPKIKSAFDIGCKIFGENKTQEALPKIEELKEIIPDINFHFIGQLQANKVNQAVGNFSLIHSVDRVKLLNRIDNRAAVLGLVQDILIQVNLSNEKQKGGASIKELAEILELSKSLKNVNIKGLMTIPPLAKKPEDNRKYFAKLKNIFETYKKEFPNFEIISMGMSDDFGIAVEEGATHIRVGSALFGNR